MEVKLEVDATGRPEGKGQIPFPFAPVPKVRVGHKSGHARIASLKVCICEHNARPFKYQARVSLRICASGWSVMMGYKRLEPDCPPDALRYTNYLYLIIKNFNCRQI